MSERKLTYDFLLGLANHHGLILEKENRTIDRIRYKYSVTSNQSGMTEYCCTLDEAYHVMMELK